MYGNLRGVEFHTSKTAPKMRLSVHCGVLGLVVFPFGYLFFPTAHDQLFSATLSNQSRMMGNPKPEP